LVVVHEFSESWRILLVGATVGSSANSYDPLDLFHYSAAGVRTFSGSNPGYFSIDGGSTSLNTFNTVAGGDAGDWAGVTVDAFNAFSTPGVVLPVSHTDLTTLGVIGWDAIIPPAPVFGGLAVNPNASATLSGAAAAGHRSRCSTAPAASATTTDANDTWSADRGQPLNTVHVFTATATDPAGNVSGTTGSAQLGSSNANV
jgi:hypothetical protein